LRIAYRVSTDEECIDKLPVGKTSLVALLGRFVLDGQVQSNRELMLLFDGGGRVKLVDDSENVRVIYYKIRDQEVVV
jgi:hypothetical protein